MTPIDPHTLRANWRRQRAVQRWRRASRRWWLAGGELDFGQVWRTWCDANDGDQAAALGHLLLVLDRVGLLDDGQRR